VAITKYNGKCRISRFRAVVSVADYVISDGTQSSALIFFNRYAFGLNFQF
jgi:hypothetical protein